MTYTLIPAGRTASVLFLAASMLSIAGCSSSRTPGTAGRAAMELIDAFNRHDPVGMAALVTPEFELYYMNEDGTFGLATKGRAALVAEMESYFSDRPRVASTVEQIIDGSVYVAFREQIVGGRSSIAVYEIRDGLIRRVWYYPAE